MFWYTTASLTPAILLALACFLGGVFPLFGVLSITVLVFFLDKLSGPNRDVASSGRNLSLILAGVHFPLLALGVWALSMGNHLDLLDKLLIFTGLGLYFGQVSNSNAHELIHASTRIPQRLGVFVYTSLLHGHHVSAHLRVHHIYAATDADPNSARPGEGFWRFAMRALAGEFKAGLNAEKTHRARASAPLPPHPYLTYVGGGFAVVALVASLTGLKGLGFFLAIALYAQLQLLLSDYVQHYGLRRRPLQNGKPEPMGPHHSWNAPKWYSSAMMLNAPKHSDHHLRPKRAFPALRVTPDTMPILPHSLPVMAVLALIPPLWRKVMDRRVAQWQNPA
ncbi:MAG: alkane 1-monooxygenase [Sulfitobacter sp.]